MKTLVLLGAALALSAGVAGCAKSLLPRGGEGLLPAQLRQALLRQVAVLA